MKYRSDSPSDGDSHSASNSTATASLGGAAAASPRHKSKSGIFDISRSTDLKSPVELFGYSASTSTKERAQRNARSAGLRADFFRFIFAMIAVPALAAITFFHVTGRSLKLDFLISPEQLSQVSLTGRQHPARRPASTFPVQQTVAPAPSDTNHVILPSPRKAPRPLVLQFDSNGRLTEPFSFELDENGLEISRLSPQDVLALRGSIMSEEFRGVSSITKISVPADFTAIPNAHPFVYSAVEKNRLTQLRESAPEIGKLLSSASATTAERLRVSPIATSSLQAVHGKTAEQALEAARHELSWVRKAALTANVSGDSLIEKRIIETLLVWSKTYYPSGNARIDEPVFDLLYGYDFVRGATSEQDRKNLDAFFKDMVDRQFSQARSYKEYDLEHAIHTLFAIAVGFITEDVALQYYGTKQFQAHLENSTLSGQAAFGPSELETLRVLLLSAYIYDRSGSTMHKSEKLNAFVTAMNEASQDNGTALMDVMGAAAYFRPELYPRIATLSAAAGGGISRFGTGTNALLAALRKPTSTLIVEAVRPAQPMTPARAPARAPKLRR